MAVTDPCRNALHDYPLPSSYVGASDEADKRLGTGWHNLQCPDCKLYGWRPPKVKTVKPPANRARLVLTFEVEFPPEELRQQPPHLREAVDLLRQMLRDGEAGFAEDFSDMIGEEIEYGGKVVDVKIEAAK